MLTPERPTKKKKKKLLKPKIFLASSTYIAPHSCGSKIASIVRRDEFSNYYGNVELHDCGRQINWQLPLYSEEGKHQAIAKLRAARAALAEIQSVVERLEYKPLEPEQKVDFGPGVATSSAPR